MINKIYIAPDDMCTSLKLEMKRAQDFFIANGWSLAEAPEAADIILAGTCVGFENLEKRSLDRIEALNSTGRRVVAVGCLAEFNPTGLAGVHRGPVLKAWEFEKIESFLKNPAVPLSKIPPASTFRSRGEYRLYDLSKRYVSVTQGCSFACAYCPHTIGCGELRSRPPDDILEQIARMLAENTRIIVLTGVETSLYGRDIGATYPELLRAVLGLGHGFDVHVAQFHPFGAVEYADELGELFGNPRVTDIQIPVETTSARLLGLMNRLDGAVSVEKLLTGVRKRNGRAVFRTDLLVGFPTETMEELEESVYFMGKVFDETAVYGFEMKTGAPVAAMGLARIEQDEIRRRVRWAVQQLDECGRLAHAGAQEDPDMRNLEQRRQALRAARGCA